MKRIAIGVLLAALMLACTPAIKNEPPLETGGSVNPPVGCVELRARGGSC